MDQKIIAVVGATGAQGGGLVRAIVADKSGEYVARAITRKPESDKARELARLGVEVVAADLDDPPTVERAFAGAYGAFCVTNFWEHLSGDKELTQAVTMAHAAKNTGVAHVLWSSFEDTRRRVPLSDNRMPTLGGKYKVPHFDAKGEAEEHFRALGLPVTIVWTSFYWENFIFFGMGPKRIEGGKLAIVLPMGDKRLPGMAAEDIGKCSHGIFRRGSELVGKTVGIAGEMLTGTEMATAMSRALEQPVIYTDVDPEVYRRFGFPGSDDLGNMFQYKRDFNTEYCAARDVALSRALNPELLTFPQWLARNKSRIPLP